jgi:hypothetical protein
VLACHSTEAAGNSHTWQFEGTMKIVKDEFWKDAETFIKLEKIYLGYFVWRQKFSGLYQLDNA